MSVRIGTSGWIYPHWRGRFYPAELRAREWFAFYARTFDTVEVNNSFYRLPSAETFEAWRAQAPPGFLYAVKASRFLTHYKHLKDPQEPLRTFFERAAHLGGTLGPVLYQLPPRWRVNLERLEHFLAALPAGYTHVVELRDETWITEAVFQLLERYRVAHCIHDYYTLRVPLRVTAPPVYVRFHGDVDHAGDYPEARLKTWAKRIAEWQSEGLDVYAYFNNDAAPTQPAPLAARTLRRLCGLE